MTPTALLETPDERSAAAAFRSILVVVEFDRHAAGSLSAASRSALRHAAVLAGPAGGRVTALHVLPRQPRVLVAGADSDDGTRAVARAAQRVAAAVAAERVPARVDTETAAGVALDEIDRMASRVEADLIIAGYQDRPGAYSEGFSFRALLHRAPCPVLVTRATDALPPGWEP